MSIDTEELKFTETHEWVRIDGEGLVTVGITDHAQTMLGDIVFVEVPGKGSMVRSGNDVAVIESVKAASDIYAPLDGEVIEVNETVLEAPELINTSPYGDGWLFRMSLDDVNQIGDLLDYQAYQKVTEGSV